MAHENQQKFCLRVKEMFPTFFEGKIIVDVGSMDIVGCNKDLFVDCDYLGIDLGEGKNVDLICPVEDFYPNHQFDVAISTEMLEHAVNWEKALLSMYRLLKSGGLLVLTAGGEGRGEHGTIGHAEWASPFTNGYYRNISNEMFSGVLKPEMFDTYYLKQDREFCDIQFFGVKR